MGYIYPCAVTLILSTQVIAVSIAFLTTWDRSLIPLFFFGLIIPVQYILNCRYVRQDHLDNLLTDVKHSNRTRKSQEKEILYPRLPSSFLSIVIVGTITIICTVTNALLFAQGLQAGGFDILTERFGDHWFMYTGLVFHWLYSWGTLVSNLYIFMYVFSKHLTDFRALNRRIEEMIFAVDQAAITGIGREIVGLRFALNQSVEALQGFYTSVTLLGAFGIGAVIEYKVLDVYTIFYICLYALLQLIFLTFIYQISERRADILKILRSPQLLFKYLTNVQSMHNIHALRTADIPVESLQRMRIAAYCPRTYAEVAHQPASRPPPHMELKILDNCDMPTDALESASTVSTATDSTGSTVSVSAMENGYNRPSATVAGTSTESTEAEILALSYKNTAAMDWIILNSLLSEQWAEFTLLGVSFSDAEVIKKSTGLISLAILGSTFLNSLTVA